MTARRHSENRLLKIFFRQTIYSCELGEKNHHNVTWEKNKMPNRLTTVTLILICVLLLHAGCEEQAMAPQALSPDWFQQFQQPTRPTTTPRAGISSPRIAFEKVVHDFGDIGPGTSNLCEFRFTNTGNGILKIGEIGRTCGCTPFSLAKTQYAPGESGTLKVNYYSDTQRGPTTKHLLVHSNDRAQPEVILAVQARIISKVDYEPKTLNLVLKQENAGCPNITLTSIDNQPFSIRHFKSTGNCITADHNPSVKATSFVIQPKVDMAKLEKTLNGRIEIGLTHPECKTITVSLNTLPKFKIAPRSIIVRGVEPKKPIVKKVRILNNYNEDFELESTSSRNGTVKVLSNAIVPDGYELELEIMPPASENKKRLFTEEFFVKIRGGEQLEIPCSVFYSSAPDLSLTSSKETKECKTCKPTIFYPPSEKNKGS